MRNGALPDAPADAEIRTAFGPLSEYAPRERGRGLAQYRRRAHEASREPTRGLTRGSERSTRNPILTAAAISDVHRVEASERRRGFLNPAANTRLFHRPVGHWKRRYFHVYFNPISFNATPFALPWTQSSLI